MIRRALFAAEEPAIDCLVACFVDLTCEAESDGRYWLSGNALGLGDDDRRWHNELDAFSRRANTVLALTDPEFTAIHPLGSVELSDGTRRHCVTLAEAVTLEVIFSVVTLSARGGGPVQRPLAIRAAELAERQPRFERATNILAEAGEDMTKLYWVMELIEKAHGGFPPKKKGAVRALFCQRIQVEQAEWEALHRTARPYRHAEPHEDDGPVLSPRRARILLQHALKLWLEREVPA